jgi:hypothetical protein
MIKRGALPPAGGEDTRRPLPDDRDRDGLLTIDEMAAEIGLTSRTIRSYHARRLLPPPVRIGRKPYYGRAHLNRMRGVLRLQGHGLPLEAIRALLEPDVVVGECLLPSKSITAALRAEPPLFGTLLSTGVLTARPDGGLSVRSARAVMAAHMVHGGEVPIRMALWDLADSIVAMLPFADAAMASVRTETRGYRPATRRHGDDLLEFLVEVFRLCLMRVSDGWSPGGADQLSS